jgi:hypothetical protein
LAISILLSSTGLVISKHFCQNELVDVSIFSKATSCQEEEDNCLPSSTERELIQPRNCCKDSSNHLKVEVEQQAEVQSDFFENITGQEIPLTNASINQETCVSSLLNRFKYKPPLLVYNIPVNLQVFLC